MLLEEQREADDGRVNQQTAEDRHGCGTSCDFSRMPQERWERWCESVLGSIQVSTGPLRFLLRVQARNRPRRIPNAYSRRALTDTHDHEEAGQEPSKVDHTVSRTLHKVIMVRCSAAKPVG